MDIRVVNLSYFIPEAAPAGAKANAAAAVAAAGTGEPPSSSSSSSGVQDNHVCLLHSVCAEFRQGTVTALMGPSGAGKTTLMDVVAEKKHSGVRTGQIFYGEATCIRSKQDIAYVQSSDVHIGEFTVAQNLHFSALLRLGCGLSEAELRSRCEEAAAAVGLSGVMGVPVGTELIKGISGGQKKRLSVATELLALPSVMCLDEPTTGLDSSTSLQLAECLTHLATNLNKTIICTVHQPSVDMLRCWQQLVLLADGRIAYAGPIFEVTSYLQTLGHQCNTDNPVEFALELLGSPEVAHAVTSSWSITAKQMESANRGDHSDKKTASAAPSSQLVSLSRSDTTLWQQTSILFRRQLLGKWKSINGYFAMGLRNVLAGLLFAMLYFGDGASLQKQDFIIDPFTGLFTSYCNNILGVNFTCLMFLLFANAIAIPAMFSARRLFDREQGEKLYSHWAFWAGTLMVDIPELLLGTALFDIMVSESVQINGDKGVFYCMTFLTSIVGYAMAKLCAWLTSSALSSLVLFSMACSINLIICGFLIVSDNIDPYLRWLLNVSFPQWSIGQLIHNEFNDFKGAQGDAVLAYYSFEDMNLVATVFILLLFFAAFEAVSLYYMRPVTNSVEVVESSSPKFSELDALQARAPEPIRDTMASSAGLSIASSHHGGKSVLHDSLLAAHDPEAHFADAPRPSNRIAFPRTMEFRQSDASGFGGPRKSNLRATFASAVESVSTIRDFADDVGNMRNTYTENKLIFEPIEQDPAVKKVRLEFRDVKYSVGSGSSSRVLLDGVFGGAKSGEMLAVMGSSGAGKTTLLNVIAGRANSGVISGSITANGETFLGFRRNVTTLQTNSSAPSFAYVMQDDIHIPCLTVKETLEFAAMLRLRVPRRSDARVQDAVRKIIKMLGLKKIAENVIGTPQNRNISCGQIRRLSIGVEIVHDPMLIFLDEPTSGLDSYLAATVVEGMKTLALSGRTLLCTIHQPSTEVFSRFDKLLLLSAGCPIYFGPVAACRRHFESLGIACHQENPAEYVITVAAVAASNGSTQGSQYTTKSLAGIMADAARTQPDSPLSRAAPTGAAATVALNDWSAKGIALAELSDLINAWPIMLVLLQRDWLTLRRRNFLIAISFRMLLLGVFIGLLWRDIRDNDYLERISLFVACYIMNTVWLVEIIPTLHEDKVMFYRERDASATSTTASWITQGLPTAACALVFDMIFCVPVYAISRLNRSVESFLFFFVVVYVLMLANLYIQQLIAAVTPSPMIHTIFFPGLIVPLQGMFSGYVVLVETMEPWFEWGTVLNPVFWMLNALFQNEFAGNSALDGVDQGALEATYGWGASAGAALSGIIAILVVHKVLAYLGMRFVNHSSA